MERLILKKLSCCNELSPSSLSAQTEIFRTEQRNLFSKYADKRRTVSVVFPQLLVPCCATLPTDIAPLLQSIEQIKAAVKKALGTN